MRHDTGSATSRGFRKVGDSTRAFLFPRRYPQLLRASSKPVVNKVPIVISQHPRMLVRSASPPLATVATTEEVATPTAPAPRTTKREGPSYLNFLRGNNSSISHQTATAAPRGIQPDHERQAATGHKEGATLLKGIQAAALHRARRRGAPEERIRANDQRSCRLVDEPPRHISRFMTS